MLGEDLSDLLRDGLVDLEARFHEDQVGTLPLCRHRRHGGSHAELAGFVARRGHNAPLVGSSDGDRLAAELRIVPLFDGCVEGVHVDVDDLPLAVFFHRSLLSLRRPDLHLDKSDRPRTKIEHFPRSGNYPFLA